MNENINPKEISFTIYLQSLKQDNNCKNYNKSIPLLKNTNKGYPSGLYLATNSNDLVKYTLYDQETTPTLSTNEKKNSDVNKNDENQFESMNVKKKKILRKSSLLSPIMLESMRENQEIKQKVVDNFVNNQK